MIEWVEKGAHLRFLMSFTKTLDVEKSVYRIPKIYEMEWWQTQDKTRQADTTRDRKLNLRLSFDADIEIEMRRPSR